MRSSLRIAVFILAAVAIILQTTTGFAATSRDILRQKLPSGLTVIIEENHSSPVAAIQIWVKTGSADEKDIEAGIAHVFEHMLFKGTEKRAVGEIASEVEAAGGQINAYTSYDHTVYHIVIASRYLEKGIDIISDAVRNSTFDPDELAKELEVVNEELRMGEDSPRRKLFKTLLATAYTKHPYRKPVIGYKETVNNLSRERIIDFFKRWYVPNNMTLVISGDVKKAEAMKLVKKAFKGFKKGRSTRAPRPKEPLQKEARASIISQPISESRMGLAFHIPELNNKDTFALDLLATVLGRGNSSRLYRKLKVESELVNGVSVSAMTPKDPGIFFITATLNKTKVEKAIEVTATEIQRLANEGPTNKELKKAKFALESEFIYERETMQGSASQLGFYETAYGDISFEEDYIKGITSVTSKEMKRVAKKYLRSTNLSIALLQPSTPDEEATVTEKSLIEAFRVGELASSKGNEKAPALGLPEETTKVKLTNGITVILKEEHANPTVSFYATFPGGLRFEDKETNGISSITAAMFSRGTLSRNREKLAAEVEGMAGSVGGFSGRNSIGASAKFLSRHFEQGLDIFADILTNSSFPAEEIEKLKRDRIAAIKREEDYLPGHTFKLLYKKLYSSHPYGMPVNGTEASVAKLTRKKIVSFYKKQLVPENMVLVVVGDIEKKATLDKIRSLFGDISGGSQPLKNPPSEKNQKTIRSVNEVKNKAQTHIGIGFLGTTVTDEDRYPLGVLAEVLSSQSGRLFVELRDKQSLAYSVSAFSSLGVERGIFAVYIGTSPEKKDDAIDGILGELKKIRETLVTGKELQRAKSAIIGGYEIGLQDSSTKAADMAINELLGLGYNHYLFYPEKINGVTEQDVLRVAEKYLTLDAYTISVVGPAPQ